MSNGTIKAHSLILPAGEVHAAGCALTLSQILLALAGTRVLVLSAGLPQSLLLQLLE